MKKATRAKWVVFLSAAMFLFCSGLCFAADGETTDDIDDILDRKEEVIQNLYDALQGSISSEEAAENIIGEITKDYASDDLFEENEDLEDLEEDREELLDSLEEAVEAIVDDMIAGTDDVDISAAYELITSQLMGEIDDFGTWIYDDAGNLLGYSYLTEDFTEMYSFTIEDGKVIQTRTQADGIVDLDFEETDDEEFKTFCTVMRQSPFASQVYNKMDRDELRELYEAMMSGELSVGESYTITVDGEEFTFTLVKEGDGSRLDCNGYKTRHLPESLTTQLEEFQASVIEKLEEGESVEDAIDETQEEGKEVDIEDCHGDPAVTGTVVKRDGKYYLKVKNYTTFDSSNVEADFEVELDVKEWLNGEANEAEVIAALEQAVATGEDITLHGTIAGDYNDLDEDDVLYVEGLGKGEFEDHTETGISGAEDVDEAYIDAAEESVSGQAGETGEAGAGQKETEETSEQEEDGLKKAEVEDAQLNTAGYTIRINKKGNRYYAVIDR